MEEIKSVTWDLWGEELTHEQTIQRIVNAGFPIKGGAALTMFAIVEGESGEYQRAWHANVKRNADGTILRDDQGRMTVRSIDLGFLQRNVEVSPDMPIAMSPVVMGEWVEGMFERYPHLANPVTAAEDAYDLWVERGFQPWYAWVNFRTTPEWREKKKYGALAFGNWLAHSFVGKEPDGSRLRMVWDS